MKDDTRAESRVSKSSDPPIPLGDIPLYSTNLLTLLDACGVIQYESPSIERLYGFDQNELVGTAVKDCLHPDDRKEVVEAFQTVASSEEDVVETVEYRHQKADRTYTWVESAASANPTPDGYYVISTRDISARKQREKELMRANKRLEEFASVVSHDLRNPLGVAQGHLELAEEDAPSSHHSNIADALDRMETLIDGLLANARVKTQEKDLTSVDLASLSETCWENLMEPDATLVTEIEQSIHADRFQLMQLLENLYRNAVEHGGDEIVVTVGELDNGFYIEDNGGGIPEAEREHIFEIGYSDPLDGTGFGLAIVQRVTDTHSWDLRVTESSEGGARFEITGVEFTD